MSRTEMKPSQTTIQGLTNLGFAEAEAGRRSAHASAVYEIQVLAGTTNLTPEQKVDRLIALVRMLLEYGVV